MPTMFEKIWNRHVVAEGPGGQTLLYIDRHLLHEGGTSALTRLRRSGRSVRRPTAPSGRSPSASGRARSSTCWPRSASGSESPTSCALP